MIAGGMSCFVLFFGSLYFGISPDSRYEMLYFPIFLRGLGMMILIIAFALFAVEDLNPKYLLSNAFFLIIFRSVLSPVLANVTRMVLWNGIKRDTIAMNKEMTNKYPSISFNANNKIFRL